MSRELDMRVVKAMGQPGPLDDPDIYWVSAGNDTWSGEKYWTKPYLSIAVEWPPYYSTDIAAARIMEDWIEANHPELRNDYATALYGLTCHVWQGDVCKGWAIARATPEQRCLAFLAAMEGI